jgi:hypothetical protein
MKSNRIFWFSAFKNVVPADYEAWFERLAAQGLHPIKVGQWSSIAMHFTKSEPKRYRYVIDMQLNPGKDYKQTYLDFGWEFVGQMASAYVWRREYEGARPESFSDNDSRFERNTRFQKAASVSFSILLLGGLAFAAGAIFSNLASSDRIQFGIASVFFLILAAAIGLAKRKIKKNWDK